MKRYQDSNIQPSKVSVFFTHPKHGTQNIDTTHCFI